MQAMLLGFMTGGGLIVAIGAQNAYVLRMGILRRFVLPVVLFCSLSDALLIAAGIAGMGTLLEKAPILLAATRYAGIAFLVWYGTKALRRALSPVGMQATEADDTTLTKVIATCALFTFLNPHVYLDTVILMGSIAGQQPPDLRFWFGLGGCLASLVWFSALGFGARWLAPLFQKPRAWQVLDALIAVMMFTLALFLLLGS